jgi:hypothetical protein
MIVVRFVLVVTAVTWLCGCSLDKRKEYSCKCDIADTLEFPLILPAAYYVVIAEGSSSFRGGFVAPILMVLPFISLTGTTPAQGLEGSGANDVKAGDQNNNSQDETTHGQGEETRRL